MSEHSRDAVSRCAEAKDKKEVTTFSPGIDVSESDDGFTLYADVPGARADGLDLKFEDGQLTIHASVVDRKHPEQNLLGEYGVGDFYRRISLGESVEIEKISANLAEGVLTVDLPKRDAVKPRRIQIESN